MNDENPTPPPRRRSGRPPTDPAARRAKVVGVRVSAAELAALTAKAAQASVPVPQLLRTAGLAARLPAPPVPAVNREQYSQLSRLSANLNQLAKAANEGRVIADAGDITKCADECRRLRLSLLGVQE